MLVICRCLHGSSGGAGDEKLKYYDIPSFPNNDLPLIPRDELHAPQLDPVVENQEESDIEPEEIIAEESQKTDETLVEEPMSAIEEDSQPDGTRVKEPQPEQTIIEQPQQSEPELQDLSMNFGLCEADRNSLYTCTEILGSEICDNMMTDMSEAMTEWSWSHKPQKQKVLDKERKLNMRFPPPIPRYIGRVCQFMKIKRCDRRITMSLVQMDRQPEQMHIEREDGQIKMQLMTYISDAMNNDVEASTSASTSQQVVETCDQEANDKEVEVATDKCDIDEETKKLAKAA